MISMVYQYNLHIEEQITAINVIYAHFEAVAS